MRKYKLCQKVTSDIIIISHPDKFRILKIESSRLTTPGALHLKGNLIRPRSDIFSISNKPLPCFLKIQKLRGK